VSNARKAAIGAMIAPAVPVVLVALGSDVGPVSFIHAMLLGAASAVALFGK
jgi:hypothetical protein